MNKNTALIVTIVIALLAITSVAVQARHHNHEQNIERAWLLQQIAEIRNAPCLDEMSGRDCANRQVGIDYALNELEQRIEEHS